MLSRIIEINENLSLQIKQNLDYKYAGEIWDAALVLTYFFINKKSEKIINIKNKIIIELGAGTGINGLILGALGAKKIILTDKGDCLDLLKENYENNKMKFDTNLICDIKELDWTKEDDRKKINDKIDYIIASDIIWNPKLRIPLFETINYLFENNENIEAIFSCQIRDNEIKDFLNLFNKNKYIIEKLPDNLYDDEYKADDIIIIKIRKI